MALLSMLPVLLSACSSEPKERIGDEVDIKTEIVGTWVAIDGTSNGEAPPEGYLESILFEFKDGKFRRENSAWTPFAITDSMSPAWITFDNSLRQSGIVKMVDGQLHMCIGIKGERPTKFKSAPYTDQTFLILKRKQ